MKKKIKPFYYRSEDKKVAVHIDYNDLYYDNYSTTGKFRRLLGGESDRIEAYLVRINYIKITKAQFDKQLEKYDTDRTTECIDVPIVDAGNL